MQQFQPLFFVFQGERIVLIQNCILQLTFLWTCTCKRTRHSCLKVCVPVCDGVWHHQHFSLQTDMSTKRKCVTNQQRPQTNGLSRCASGPTRRRQLDHRDLAALFQQRNQLGNVPQYDETSTIRRQHGAGCSVGSVRRKVGYWSVVPTCEISDVLELPRPRA